MFNNNLSLIYHQVSQCSVCQAHGETLKSPTQLAPIEVRDATFPTMQSMYIYFLHKSTYVTGMYTFSCLSYLLFYKEILFKDANI